MKVSSFSGLDKGDEVAFMTNRRVLALLALGVLQACHPSSPPSSAEKSNPQGDSGYEFVERTPSTRKTELNSKSPPLHVSPQPRGTAPVGAEKVQDEMGVWWIPIPHGSYQMGSDAENSQAPPHQVELLSFWMQQTEVTIAQYEECVEAQSCTAPSQVGHCKPQLGMTDDMPVSCISHTQAIGYCTFREARLPSEEEWEYAARGTDGRRYPWGDESPKKKTLVWRRWFGPAAVASTADLSFFEIADMGGNVSEWTSSKWRASYDAPAHVHYMTIRGGSWDMKEKELVTSTTRQDLEPSYQGTDVGVRCVR